MSARRARTVIYLSLSGGALAAFAVVYWWIDAVGILIGILVATVAAITILRHAAVDADLAFIHGYHAGYHAGHPALDCYGPSCTVLDAAEGRIEQERRIAAH